MKKILGLDLGTASIGWAVVNEAENRDEQSSIVKIGVRVNPLTVDEQTNFEKGKSITTNADRTLKRSMRRNLQRYKLRRDNLVEVLKNNGFISEESTLAEVGNRTTFETYRLRAKAAAEKVSLEEFARILLMINKKRGYKSSRRANSTDEGQLIDGMAIAMQLYENNLTPGQFVLSLLEQGKKYTPDFYRSDLQSEFDRIWNFQYQFYSEILTLDLKDKLQNRNEKQTWAICKEPFGIVGIKREAKGDDLKRQNYSWRSRALSERMSLEELAVVLQKINGQLKNSSGYLGAISDRSKNLFFNKQTVGQYQMAELDKNPNYSLRNEVFYRQDYLDEFEQLWDTQSKFHSGLTPELKREIRDIVIFYQRPLKSQKGLVSVCELENRQVEIDDNGTKKMKVVGPKVCPKSSPVFQEFKIWQTLNNIKVSDKNNSSAARLLNQEGKELLAAELSIKEKLSKSDALKILFKNHRELDLNFKSIDGNRTQCQLFKAYETILFRCGYGEYDFAKMNAKDVIEKLTAVFAKNGWNVDLLHFDSDANGEVVQNEPMYRLWHLLYSFEGDKSKMGNESLIEKIMALSGFDRDCASVVANIVIGSDYGSLSTKAMLKILPYMKEGTEYSVACEYAGYKHSKRSETREGLEQKVYKDKLDILPRNTLRNPVVEKIINQMINVVNTVIKTYGKPDEIRIELARELKKSAKEREMLTADISRATALYETYRDVLRTNFGIENPSRNDIIRYRLYLELQENGFKTLYSNTYIPQERLFSKDFDIEHIIPQAKLFDDSFSNKTIEARAINIEKSDATAYDYVCEKYQSDELESYKLRVESLYSNGVISRTKRNKLLMKEKDIPSGFIERDLRDSQYIAKKAREILESVVKFVVPTTGSITDRLREDWQLVDVMKELNWNKYDALGLTYVRKDKDNRDIRCIKDWTKRNDHRHHAMDALTIAFTKRGYIQYLNNLNARSDKSGSIYGIEKTLLYRDDKNKLRFIPPMPLNEFRATALEHLQETLVSIKAKNKVVTQNTNIIKVKSGTKKIIQLTPRGQLHNETIYGSINQYATKLEKVGSSFDAQTIEKVANKRYREALMRRLEQYGGDAKKAFTGNNSLEKMPLYLDEMQTVRVPERVKTVSMVEVLTIRKAVSPDLKIDKVIDVNVRRILQRRLDEYGGDPKKAFVNLDEEPIWLNKIKGIAIKRVTITGVSNALALHSKRDHLGKYIIGDDGFKQVADYVSTGNNHHVAIYRDADGNFQEYVVSFFEATARVNQNMPIVDKNYKQSEGWQFLFTMKQNEYFVFPNQETGFDPKEVDLLDPNNYSLISPNLFRVQKLAVKNYVFRHHLETTVDDTKELRDVTWRRITSLNNIDAMVKVRVNHIGQIVSVGEY